MKTYLIVSETNYYINEKLKELQGNIDNVITFNLEENKLDEVLEEASYFSMFSEEKCLIVKNANFFGSTLKGETNKSKEDSEKLIKYMDNPNPHVKLIFIYKGKVDTKKKIYNILNDNHNVYANNKLTKTDMKNELSKIVSEMGYKIDDKSLWYIINNSLNNFDIAINELKKIMMYYNKKCLIEYNDVINLTSKTSEENDFKLVDSIIRRDLESSLKDLNETKIFKVEPSNIIRLIYREFKLMLATLLYEEKKCSDSEIASNLKLAPWQLDKVHNNLRLYKKWEIEDEIRYISKIDYLYKSGLINRDVVLINYIFHIC